jgi:hypothetical protein
VTVHVPGQDGGDNVEKTANSGEVPVNTASVKSSGPPAEPNPDGNGHADPAIMAASAGTPDEFDKLIRKPGSAAAIPTRRLITTILTGRPPKHSFFRAHSEKGKYTLELRVVRDENDFGKEYIVAPNMDGHLWNKSYRVAVALCITMQGMLFMMTVRLADENSGRMDSFNESLLPIVEEARTQWVTLTTIGKTYVSDAPRDKFPDPEWPEITMIEALKIAFRGRVIESLEHPLAKRLLGIM